MSDPRAVVGIDVGGTKIATALVSPAGELITARTVPTPTSSDTALLRRLEMTVTDLLADAGEPVAALGVGLPGVIDSSAGVAVSGANVPWAHTAVAPYLREAFGLPAYIDNDANAGALGERWFGRGRGVARFVYVSVGTGIGSGVVVDGHLLPDNQGHSSELGHTIVELNGPPCACGSRGCLETLAAGPSLTRRMRQKYGREASGQQIFAAAAQGDPQAQAVLEETVVYLAVGVINAWRLLTPDLVIVGGGVARAGQQLLTPLRRAVAELAPKDPVIAASVELAQLGGASGVLGAAAVALEKLGGSAPAGAAAPAR